ncbi:MAG: hypothetical protein GY811_03935 [Myxococcales bacterium]|nr:hypothetical protein [Myxococcales bacterium]
MMRTIAAALLGLALAATACGDATNTSADAAIIYDADPFAPDAEQLSCAQATLEIGRCQLAGEGGPCTGSLEEAEFVAVEPEGGRIGVIVGPQGADMMVLSLRTSGIDPGDLDNPASTDRPDVSVQLYRNEEETMAHYVGRPSFLGEAQSQEALGIYLVIERAVRSGDVFRVVAEVEDQDGEYRCGSLRFIAE